MTETKRYTAVAITLHWIIAAAIVSMILMGWYMTDMPLGAPGQEALYQFHKSVGITILILTIARIAWRIMNPPPPHATGMAGWERTLSTLTHYGFYALMLALPFTGWLYVSTAYEFDVPTVLFGVISWPDIPGLGFLSNEAGHGAVEFAHSKLAWVALALLALHLAGALKHEFTNDEGVFERMIPGLYGTPTSLVRPARGHGIAFGSALAVFAIVAGLPVIAQAGNDGALEIATVENANWTVDYEASSISFSGMHDGAEYTGSFENWSAAIAFDPDAPSLGRAEVTVRTGSAVANKKLYTDSLKGPEWFDANGQPEATVIVDGIRPAGGSPAPNAYDADATITIKDTTLTVPFQFTLNVDGDRATMTGQSTLSRGDFDLGLGSDPGFDWVAEAVKVTVNVTAKAAS